MKKFHVYWDATITAESHEDAANIALEMMTDTECPARSFKVGEPKKAHLITEYKEIHV
jgi:hypothetical protein